MTNNDRRKRADPNCPHCKGSGWRDDTYCMGTLHGGLTTGGSAGPCKCPERSKVRPDWLNLAGEMRLYWEPWEDKDRTILHFVDATGKLVKGYVQDLVTFLAEPGNKTMGWTERVDIQTDGYQYQIENAKMVVFCNHENRPDHALVEVGDLDLTIRDDKEITIRHKGWENG